MRIKLYIDILMEMNTYDYPNIISLNDYINMATDNKNDILDNFELALLFIFIHIFYFEKSLLESTRKEDIIEVNKKYYLINPKWMKEFKEYYNYQKLSNLLKELSKTNKINYNNFDKSIDSIIKSVLGKDALNFQITELSQNLMDINKINPSKGKIENITFFKNCQILPLKIVDYIKKIFFENNGNIESREIQSKGDYLFLLHTKGIEIGNLNEEAIFIKKYIIIYNSVETFKSEKNSLISIMGVKKYLELRQCSEKEKYNKIQIMKLGNENIGKLIVLKDVFVKKKLSNIKKENTDKVRNIITDNTSSFTKNIFDMENETKIKENNF